MSQLKRDYTINGEEVYTIVIPYGIIERLGWREGDWIDILLEIYYKQLILQNKSKRIFK